MNHTKFCCCAASRCNLNFTDAYIPEDEVPTTQEPPATNMLNPIICVVISVAFISFIIALIIISYMVWKMKPNKNDVESVQHHLSPPEEYSLDKLKLFNVIGKYFVISIDNNNIANANLVSVFRHLDR